MLKIDLEGEIRAFSREDLEGLPGQVEDVATRHPGRQGRGVELASLLKAAGISGGAERLELISADASFRAELGVEEAADAFLVYALDGGPLPKAMGGPIRFFLHDAEACKGHGDAPCANVKDLVEIRVR